MRYGIVALVVLVAACGSSDQGGLTSPTTGSLEIRTATSGQTTGEYTVSVDGGAASPIGLNATTTLPEVEGGSHTVLLAGLPDGCTVSGENPRTVSVAISSTTTVAFDVTCVPPIGTIQVVTATNGPAPDGYELLVDGTSQGAIGATTTRSLESISSGVHSIGLSGLPANCQLSGANPQSTTVAIGGSVTVLFAISCTAPPAETGTLSITTTTTGTDADGYQVAVDGGSPQPISLTGTVTLLNVSVGSHRIRLSGLATACSVSGPNPRSAIVTVGATATVAFSVTCLTSGSLRVVTVTTGAEPDADGYAFAIDDQAPQLIGANATVTVANVAAGSHTVTLSGLADICAVEGENPRATTVAGGATAELGFAIGCPPAASGPWIRMESGTRFELHSIWGSSATDIFTVGEPGARFEAGIFHYNGQSWSKQSTQPGATLYGIWGSSATDVFAVGSDPLGDFGNDGVLLHYNGSVWSPMTGPGVGDDNTEVTFTSVWGTSATDVFAVGHYSHGFDNALVAHYNGITWSKLALTAESDRVLNDVHGTSSQDVYAVGYVDLGESIRLRAASRTASRAQFSSGLIVHYNGITWTEVVTPGDGLAFDGVWSAAPNDVFAVGAMAGRGAVYHYDGTGWASMTVPSVGPLTDVWGTAGTDVYAVGQEGILHYDGIAWAKIEGVTRSLRDIWGSSANNVFAVGSDGTIIHGTPGAPAAASRR